MKVLIKYKPEGWRAKHGLIEETLEHITEIHYGYDGLSGKRDLIVFESDIDGTGYTKVISEIEEFSAKDGEYCVGSTEDGGGEIISMRFYGQWAGNEKGTEEDLERCIKEVWPADGWFAHQCQRKRGYGLNKEYCKQHAKKHKDKEGL